MKHSICAAAMLAIAACAAGSAQAATPGPAACLQPIRFDSWKAVDNQTVIITDRLRQNFKLSLQPGCFEVDYAMQLGVRSFSNSQLSCITRGDYVIVPSNVGLPRQRCRIEKVEVYTADMAKADALAKAKTH